MKRLPAPWQLEQFVETLAWFMVKVAKDAAEELWQSLHWAPAVVGMCPAIWPVAALPL